MLMIFERTFSTGKVLDKGGIIRVVLNKNFNIIKISSKLGLFTSEILGFLLTNNSKQILPSRDIHVLSFSMRNGGIMRLIDKSDNGDGRKDIFIIKKTNIKNEFRPNMLAKDQGTTKSN